MYRHRRLSSSSMTASRGDSLGADTGGTRVLDPGPENSALGMTPVGYMDLHWMGAVTCTQRDEGREATGKVRGASTGLSGHVCLRAHEGLDGHSYLNAHGEFSELNAAPAQGAHLSITDVWSRSAKARQDA